jgi:hypothetical protein
MKRRQSSSRIKTLEGAIMGLDIIAYAVPAGASKGEKFHYWRKHHELLEWCSALAVSRGGEAWEEPAQAIDLTDADLDSLERDVTKGKVRDCYGGDRRADDLAFIEKARAVIAQGLKVEVVFSW